jgi:D-aspartate ligase
MLQGINVIFRRRVCAPASESTPGNRESGNALRGALVLDQAPEVAGGHTNSQMRTARCPVLVLGSGLTGIGVVRSLGRAGHEVYSICGPQEPPTQSRWCLPIPKTWSPHASPAELATYLTQLPLPHAVLIPCSDDWTRAVAELPETLRDRFPSSISSASVIHTLIDKWCFAEMLQQLDVPRPKTLLVRSLEDMAALPDSSYENMFLKPLNSQEFSLRNGLKAFRPATKKEALEFMAQTLRDGNPEFPILLQEYIPGPSSSYYLVDGFVDRHGRLDGLFARRQLRMYPTLFGNSTMSETIPIEQMQGPIQALKRMWSALGFRGIFDAEFKYDERDGQYKIVEVNARPWWFVEFATRCGVDLCGMAYQDALGLPVEPSHGYEVGRRCVYLLRDLATHRAADRSLRGLLRWARSVKGADEIMYRWDDPRPGITSTLASMKKYLRQGFRSRR